MPREPVSKGSGAADTLLPSRRLPVVYFTFAHLSALAAFAIVALDPDSVTGFFYHPRMLAVVHLVTLGWITCAIVGALFVVGPLVLRMPMRATRADGWACVTLLVGIAGMVSHFWIEQVSGMAWSALMTWAGLGHVAWRVTRALRGAAVPGAIRLHVRLALFNIMVAGAMGVLIAFDKEHDLMPGYALGHVYAHAHLAAIGWATMMVVGVGYRMLPMVLPAAMPAGATLYLSAALLELGALGLFVSLATGRGALLAFAALAIAGLAAFFSHVAWMVRHPRPPAVALPRPDVGVGHALVALVSLAGAAALGVVLAVLPASALTVRLAPVYGALGLVAFLGQMVIGMESRLMPMFAWYVALERHGMQPPPVSVHALAWPLVQRTGFALWVVGLPVLLVGLFTERAVVVGAAGWLLLAAVALNTLHVASVLRRATTK